ncbi:hypothetical protein KSS87_004884 [Heliosperma pusillum]|nr:hypothetical protein KSS87_004884 [Heliosperma pusillum]
MTVEVAIEETQKQEVVVSQEEAKMVIENEVKVSEKPENEEKDENDQSKPALIEKSSSYREESNNLSDLKESERKALAELKSLLKEAILGNTLLQKPEEKKEKDDELLIWGVPLLPSKGTEGTDVILLKFLRAREFKVNETFEMLKKTLIWRENFNIGSILEEELGIDLENAAYMKGYDRENHPVCYNIFGVFSNQELYQKTFGSEEKREQFLRWRFQFMERGIKKLDFRPGGVTSILQVYDLKNCPGPSKKEIRNATFKAIGLLQDNYPELVAKNVSFFPCF